jgi:DNA recombination protein RmuC
MTDLLLIIVALLAVGVLLLQVVSLLRRPTETPSGNLDRLARELRADIAAGHKESRESAVAQRTELSGGLNQFSQTLQQQMATIASVQNNQIDSFAQQLAKLVESNERRLVEVRVTLETKLKELQAESGAKLEEMRKTVDERLHATLEKRLGESFKIVSERLEAVHKGLGEMQTLAVGVGDLKRVLTNVKTRGTWSEVQLGMLLEQFLANDQYGANVETVPGSGKRVEFAIKFPGREGGAPVWLPIDAKFPKEQYERLVEAAERGDAVGVQRSSKELEDAVMEEAKTISSKYVFPPHTTDFAIMFLPTEGLYAEVLRRPGLSDRIQREYRVTVAGPTTLTALLNSFQMGFRTLALEHRSAEVWEVLGAIKTEFAKFGEALAGVRKTLETAANKIGEAETRSRQMSRKLKDVEALPAPEAARLLDVDEPPESSQDDAAA